MAEILIPIKEFPRCCGSCPCFHAETPMYCQADKTIKMTAPYGKRMEGCPLGELPEDHGRIVDLDKVLDWLINEKRVFSMAMSAKVVKALSDAPVVLEAST